MSKPEPDAPAPGPAPDGPPAASAPAGEVTTGGVTTGEVTDSPVADAQPAPAPAKDPRVELAKPVAADAAPPAVPTADPAASEAPEAPEAPAGPAVPTAEPADPWAVPTSAPTPAWGAEAPAGAPTGAWAGASVPPVPPSAASGWAAVPPGALSGFQPGHPYPLAPTVTNGFAVAALVTGLLCMWPLALAFGVVALVQIPKRNERGRGMAVTGVITGALGAVLVVLVVGLGLVAGVDEIDRADRPGRVPKAPPGAVLWSSLKAGDCYNPTGEDAESGDPESGDRTVFWVLKAPCADPHRGEAAGIARVPDGAGSGYPGETRLRDRAAALCGPLLDEYALDYWAVPNGMEEVYLYPSRANWQSGERSVTCTYEDRYAQHRGSVRTDRSKLTPAQLAYLETARTFNNVFWSEPEAEIADAPAQYADWARQMADASRKEADELSRASTLWPEGAKPKVAELVAAQRAAATTWDTASHAAAGAALERELRQARSLVAKSAKLSLEIRRELGLSTGEQVGEIQT